MWVGYREPTPWAWSTALISLPLDSGNLKDDFCLASSAFKKKKPAANCLMFSASQYNIFVAVL